MRFVSGGDATKLKGWTIYDFFQEFDLLLIKLEKEAKAAAKAANKSH